MQAVEWAQRRMQCQTVRRMIQRQVAEVEQSRQEFGHGASAVPERKDDEYMCVRLVGTGCILPVVWVVFLELMWFLQLEVS